MRYLTSRVSLVLVSLVVLQAGGHAAQSGAPPTGGFSSGPNLGERRAGHTVTLLTDGRLLVTGGVDGTTGLASALLVDPITRAVRITGSLTTARFGHTATLLNDGRVLIAGGRSISGRAMTPLASAEIYEPASGQFVQIGNMISARASHAAALLPDGRVLVCGGYGPVLENGVTPVHITAEVFDPTAGRFAAVGSMTVGRSAHSATRLESGQVLITSSGTAELYDPATGRFARIANPTVQRAEHTATLLRDGRVLLAGGMSSRASTDRAELYDPRARAFRATGGLAVARTGHTATLLPDGRVLVAGGQSVTPGASAGAPYTVATTAAAEVFDPGAGTFSGAGVMTVARGGHAAALTATGVWMVAGLGPRSLDSTEIFGVRALSAEVVADLERLTVPAAALPANCRLQNEQNQLFLTNPAVVTDPVAVGYIHLMVFGSDTTSGQARPEDAEKALTARAADVEAGYAARYREQGGSPEIGVFALRMKKMPEAAAFKGLPPSQVRIIKGSTAIFYWSDARADAPDQGCFDVVRRHVEAVEFR